MANLWGIERKQAQGVCGGNGIFQSASTKWQVFSQPRTWLTVSVVQKDPAPGISKVVAGQKLLTRGSGGAPGLG